MYQYHTNTAPGQAGPLVRRLQGYGKLEGLVVGPWGEGSKDMHSLVKVIAETKVANKARALGRDMSDKELGIVVSQVRKYLSISFIRAQSLCLLNRLCFLGEGAVAAAGRRDLTRRLEEGRRRDRASLLHGPHQRPWPVSRGSELCPVDGHNICICWLFICLKIIFSI